MLSSCVAMGRQVCGVKHCLERLKLWQPDCLGSFHGGGHSAGHRKARAREHLEQLTEDSRDQIQ